MSRLWSKFWGCPDRKYQKFSRKKQKIEKNFKTQRHTQLKLFFFTHVGDISADKNANNMMQLVRIFWNFKKNLKIDNFDLTGTHFSHYI